MATYYELTVPSKSEPKGFGLDWVPSEGDDPAAGRLTIKGRRVYVTYRVTEFPTGWDGRGFFLEKTSAGGDKDESSYSCFIGRNGQDRRCDCRGFEATGGCKHLLSLLALIENDWL